MPLFAILTGLSIAHLTWVVQGGVLLLAMHLVERHGRSRPLGPSRQVDLFTLLDSIPDAVFLFDNARRIVDLNRPAESLCGRAREQLRSMTIVELNQLLAARDEFDRPVESPSMGVNRALRGEIVSNVRRVFRHPADGHVIETLTSASPVCQSDGSTGGAILIVHDVTEVAQLQRQLADAQRHREVGEMAVGLAHDFNNVLDTIAQAATLLDASQDPAERHEYAEMIRRAVDRGAEIIERVREYLRTGTAEQGEIDVRQLLKEVLDLTHPLWQGRPNVEVKVELSPVSKVSANAADLRRVFTNLIINALEAMPNGGRLIVRCERVGMSARVIVSDTGQGIAPEQQKQLFVPYFTTKPQGTGLGLSGARRIIDSLHGHIRFWSQQGKGTTFVVTLPTVVALERKDRQGPLDKSADKPKAA